jgi:hypothetical protein
MALDGAARSTKTPRVPAGVDHLILGTPHLELGVAAIEEALGVRAGVGGRHPDYGTHNALVSLGPTTYLEIMAPDPGLATPPRGRFGLETLTGPRLVTWVLRCEELDVVVARAAAGGVDLGAVEAGSRRRPDGSIVAWRLSDPYRRPLGGTVPFLIAWGDTPHPAASAPHGGSLVGFRLEHPDPERLRDALAALEVGAEVVRAAEPALVATLRGPRGEIELR